MLMDRHGTSRVLFRNTRNGVKGFPHRNLHQIKLPLPTQYQTAIKVSGIMGAKKSVEGARATCCIRSRSTRIRRRKRHRWNFDPRVEWLLDYLLANRNEKCW